MPPKPKVQLDKGAWQWADTTDHTQVNEEHVRTAYRLNLPTCEKGACKRNCKGNPFCLNSLGEKSWFQPLDETKLQTFDHNEERREEGHFVGLKNLGATCYVNTFLQLWFHNPAVRKAIYEWRDPAFPDEYYPGWKPDSICGLLQVIFALLHGSIRRYVDPSPLIECLGLNTAEQQDAQEFSKLFLHVLESALSDSTSHRENIIEKQFCGSYVYVTECQNCRSQSERPATFYELDLNIRGHSTLAASIKDFLQEEKLEGDNQYMCSVCNSKQNAKRAIRLRKLPEVLNLQLLRFVFDKNKGHKKKLSSFIQFPETLDMSPFMQSSSGVGEQPTLYELAAVLIHRGPTAYSGHYIAHIREHETDSWYKFNDEEIEKMNNRKLELGKEEDNLDAGSSEKAPKASKGNHSSRNAYMLVYRLKGKEDGSPLPTANSYESALPEAVKGYVLNDNQEFENYVSEQLHVQEQSICDQKQKHEEIKMIYENLSVKSRDESWEWVTTQWLSNWLASPHASEKVKNKLFKCPHGKLRADDVVKMKCISTKGAEMLFSKYPINERFPGLPSLCEKCVVRRCREIRTKLFMADDDKLFSSVKNITFSEENETYYWVSRKHLRSWKRFALCEIDAQPISQAGLSGNEVEQDELDETPLISTSGEVVGRGGEASCSNAFDGFETSRKGDSYPAAAADAPYNSLSSPSTSPQRKCIPLCSPSHKEQAQPISSFMSSSPPPPSPSSHSAAAAPSHPCTGSSTYFSNSSNQNPQRTYSCGNSQSMDLETEIPPLVNSLSPTLEETNTSRKRKSPSPMESTQNATQTLHQVVLENNSSEHCESPDSGTVTLRTSCDANESLNHINGFGKEDMDQFLEGEENGSHERETSRTEEVQDEDVEEKFNSDILCQHGNLKIDPSGRRLVTERVWIRLLYYFPHLKPYTWESDVCIECWREQEQEQQLKNSLRQEKQGQKELLQNLYHGKSRPRILDNWAGQTAYVVCTSFIEGWKKFVKHSMVNDSVQEIVNTPLLCQHKLLVYKPEDMNSPDNFTRFTLVWENEWETLTKYYHYDVEIQVLQIPEEDHGLYTVVTIPEVCTCCLEERLKQEEEGKFLFSSQIIYIRKILEGGAGDAAADGGKENGKGYNYDPEFSAPPLQKASKGRTHEDAPPEKQMRLNSNGGGSSSSSLRKSNRHRKTRGEKEVTVSSTMTLKQLQKELFKLYSVLPMDQNLSLDGRSLNNVDATLQDLRVYPQCVIFLKADEPTSHTPSTVDDYLTVPTTPEEGFKGTNLLGR